jgi:hypothetical protein
VYIKALEKSTDVETQQQHATAFHDLCVNNTDAIRCREPLVNPRLEFTKSIAFNMNSAIAALKRRNIDHVEEIYQVMASYLEGIGALVNPHQSDITFIKDIVRSMHTQILALSTAEGVPDVEAWKTQSLPNLVDTLCTTGTLQTFVRAIHEDATKLMTKCKTVYHLLDVLRSPELQSFVEVQFGVAFPPAIKETLGMLTPDMFDALQGLLSNMDVGNGLGDMMSMLSSMPTK